MSPARAASSHLTEEQIDFYCAHRLDAEGEREVEEHYLECAECRRRVEGVQLLVEGLASLPARRPDRTTRWLAAAVIVLLVGAAGLLVSLVRARGQLDTARAVRPKLATSLSVELSPPTRDQAMQSLPAASTGIVVLNVQTYEAGAPGTRFAVRVVDGSGRSVATFDGLHSSGEGLLALPCPRELLSPGLYRIELTTGETVYAIPFEVTD